MVKEETGMKGSYMKKYITKLGAVILSAAIVALTPLSVLADEDGSYTYNYDYWGDVQDGPDFYSVAGVFTSSDLGLDLKLKNPQSLYAYGESLYVCDTGNNRIIEVKRVDAENLQVVRIIDSFKGDVATTTFSNPTDVAISADGYMFVADQGNGRILKLDPDLNYVMQFDKPVDNTLDPALPFQPSKIVIDTADRVYCVASGINKGLIKYEPDGVFSGFVGATPVTFDWMDYIWKKFATQEQRAKMESFVPTEYCNLYMDYEGFTYVCSNVGEDLDIKKGNVDVVRKLNLMGNDILVRNGDWYIIGDLYMGTGGGYTGASRFSDITVMTNDIYVCLDKNRGRCFAYDDQGNMVFAFGGNGNMDGYFRSPSSIEHIGHELYVLDELDCSITSFVPTEFGGLVFDAVEQFDDGKYKESGESWESVMKLNGNYDLAYIGIGRAFLRQKRYGEALKYFELKYDDENYSKAYKQFRKEWVEDNIVWIVIVLLLVFLVPMSISKIKSLKREIDTADIFK